MKTPPEIIIPTVTLIGALMRISDRAAMINRTAEITCDPYTHRQFEIMLAQEAGAPHPILTPDYFTPMTFFMFGNVQFRVRPPPTPETSHD